MEAVGISASIFSLLQAANAIKNTILCLMDYDTQRCKRLIERAQGLERVLESLELVSEPDAAAISSSLKEVQSTLDSLAGPGISQAAARGFVRWFTNSGDEAKLEKAEEKLENLAKQVKHLRCESRMAQTCNKKLEVPLSHIEGNKTCLNRAKPILDFLEGSKAEECRVVGIYGMPGVGKSTLLNYIWNEVSSKSPFLKRVHVQIGEEASAEKICGLQTSILEQMCGVQRNFTSCDGGREKLREYFEWLKLKKQPVFLAIDNVYDVAHIKQLLPSSPATVFPPPSNLLKEIFPTSSCIVVTCRHHAVINTILNMCDLNETDARVCCHSPTCLDPDEATLVFAGYGGLSCRTDAELLDNMVRLCKGLPLALSVLGSTFAGKARRERSEWKSIAQQWEVMDGETSETSAVTKALKISFNLLSGTCQAAFVDVAKVFYGWPWERVERILDVEIMKELKESSLISVAEDWSKCNQKALRMGYADGEYDTLHRPVVMMHDLILKFGEHQREFVTTENFTGTRVLDSWYQDLEASKCRHVVLQTGDYQQGFDKFLEKTTNLQTLRAHFSKRFNACGENPGEIIVAMEHSIRMRSHSPQSLRYLRLVKWKFSSLPMETKLSELREIHLHKCNEVIELPETLEKLEWLSIKRCANLQGFSRDCVLKWQKLQHLMVRECANVTSIPTELGNLKYLTSLEIVHLKHLKSPDLFCPRLRRLTLIGVPITNLHLDTSSLEYLDIGVVRNLRGIPEIIRSALALQQLTLTDCDSLEKLPDEVGQLTSLRSLEIIKCMNLKQLPGTLGNASSLARLMLWKCDSLEELPDEVGKLTSLTRLIVLACKNLKRLPGDIGKVSSLEKLNLWQCDSLEELPDEVGQLTSLTSLDVFECKKLKQLPQAIGNAPSLKWLKLSHWDNLEELPDEVGQWTSLISLDVFSCVKLKQLPQAIGNAPSLIRLRLSHCDNLEELPDEVGQWTSLRSLDVSSCVKLKQLPQAIGNASSLRQLDLSNCISLKALPDEVGQLTLLMNLKVSGCKNLKQLPQTIGNASSLKELDLSNCDSLEELPDEIGKLTSLTYLNVNHCKNLMSIPQAIENNPSLKLCRWSDSDSSEKLSDEVEELSDEVEQEVEELSDEVEQVE